MPLRRVVSYLLPPAIQSAIHITREVPFDRLRQFNRIFRPEQKPCLAFDDLILERPHIRCENWQAETVAQEQDATLKNVPVGQHENVGRLEVELGLVISNEVCPEQYSSLLHIL